MPNLSHLDEKGQARMVDTSMKEPSMRQAVARGAVLMSRDTVALIVAGKVPKGDVLGVARLAGIMAAKKTGQMIPMCHPIELTNIDVQFDINAESGKIIIEATAKAVARTGVEMEAMTAVSIAALTIYDMCKSADKNIVLSDIKLLSKHGGKSGSFVRQE